MNVKLMATKPLWVGHKKVNNSDIYVYGKTQREAIERLKEA